LQEGRLVSVNSRLKGFAFAVGVAFQITRDHVAISRDHGDYSAVACCLLPVA
jgi:hypothetical protein